MEELKRKVTQVGPMLGVDARDICQIHNRLMWAEAGNRYAHSQLVILLQGLPIDQALWGKINEHFEDTNTWLQEAVCRLQEAVCRLQDQDDRRADGGPWSAEELEWFKKNYTGEVTSESLGDPLDWSDAELDD